MPRRMVVKSLRTVGRCLPSGIRRRVRSVARRAGVPLPADYWWLMHETGRVGRLASGGPKRCNICGWSGETFLGVAHVESAICPVCSSSGRDRFLLWCAGRDDAVTLRSTRVLETSPRLGADYRAMMRHHFKYRASDYDQSAHRGDIRIDLQRIELPDASIDLLLTPHVLEHVPDTATALAEIHRVLAPNGRMYLQVPMVRGKTSAPTEPEFHADNTPVFWNFGWDLTGMLRTAGFETQVLVTAGFARLLTGETEPPPPDPHDFDVADLIKHVPIGDYTIAADDGEADAMGWLPPYQFATWECIRR
ncbi:MAG: class I SAM-dependent methyltransferase [Actinobacteria bacterium]|nr:class I SAM-dependent methyltransferase [Actinomycetota bacterium]